MTRPSNRLEVVRELLLHDEVIDVGCADTRLAGSVDHYVGIDLEPSRSADGLDVLAATAVSIPLRDRATPAAVCISTLQYVVDVHAALAELARVTRVGGQVLILVPNHAYVRHLVTLAAGRFPWTSPADDWSQGTVRYFTRADFEPILAEHGLVIRHVVVSGRFRRIRSRWPGRLGADLIYDLERT